MLKSRKKQQKSIKICFYKTTGRRKKLGGCNLLLFFTLWRRNYRLNTGGETSVNITTFIQLLKYFVSSRKNPRLLIDQTLFQSEIITN